MKKIVFLRTYVVNLVPPFQGTYPLDTRVIDMPVPTKAKLRFTDPAHVAEYLKKNFHSAEGAEQLKEHFVILGYARCEQLPGRPREIVREGQIILPGGRILKDQEMAITSMAACPTYVLSSGNEVSFDGFGYELLYGWKYSPIDIDMYNSLFKEINNREIEIPFSFSDMEKNIEKRPRAIGDMINVFSYQGGRLIY